MNERNLIKTSATDVASNSLQQNVNDVFCSFKVLNVNTSMKKRLWKEKKLIVIKIIETNDKITCLLTHTYTYIYTHKKNLTKRIRNQILCLTGQIHFLILKLTKKTKQQQIPLNKTRSYHNLFKYEKIFSQKFWNSKRKYKKIF